MKDKERALEFIEKSRHRLTANDQITKEQFTESISLVWEILETFLKSPRDEKNYAKFTKQIMQLCKFVSRVSTNKTPHLFNKWNHSRDPSVATDFATNLLENLQSEREILELKLHEKTTTRVSIQAISYRFDISMMEETEAPILILDFLLSNGTRRTFRLPFSIFHRMRFATARLLKEITFLETRQIITR